MSTLSASILNAVLQGLLCPAVVIVTAWACGFDSSNIRAWAFGITCMLGGMFLGELDRRLRRTP